MSSLLSCEKLRLSLVGVLVFGVVSCGGKAGREELSLAAGGTSGASSGAAAGGTSGASSSGAAAGAAAPEPTEPEPSTVRVIGNDGDVDPRAAPDCTLGFQGFYARVAGMTIEFHAFVFEPGDYQGDPLRILWLDVVHTNGEHYRATAGTAAGGGNISLHVAQVEPRFIGSLEASLPALDDPMRAPLTLALDFDIAVRAGCP